MKILVTKPFRSYDQERLICPEGSELVYAPELTERDLAEADAILGQPSLEEIHRAARLRWVQSTSAGVDNYLSDGNFPQGVTLTNASGIFSTSISEFVLTYVLTLYKGMQKYRDGQKKALWQDLGWQHSPKGKRLLIVGAGDIGTAVAQRFRPFGCHITGIRRTERHAPAEFDDMLTMDRLDDALPQADIVVCALPNTPHTKGLFGRERLALLKKSAVFVNVGRGNLVDCMALAELLNEGGLYGAALDVTDPEPLPEDHPLWQCDNAIVTPHITGGTFGHFAETEENLFRLCNENLVRFCRGEKLQNLVDPERGYRIND